MAHRSDDWLIANVHNTARFFTEHPHISWMTLVATLIWGIVGYARMPQRKDPDIPVKVAMAIGRWPGVEATRVEQLVARRIEETMAENVTVKELTSTSRLGVTFVLVTLKEEVDDPAKEFDDIKLRLDGITDLPQGAQPIEFIRDFGSTAALMLTVASPKASEVVVSLKAGGIEAAIRHTREAADGGAGRATLVYAYPATVPAATIKPAVDLFIEDAIRYDVFRDARPITGPGFVGVDGITALSDSAILAFTEGFVRRTPPLLGVPSRRLAGDRGPGPGGDARPTDGAAGARSTATASWNAIPTSSGARSRASRSSPRWGGAACWTSR